MTNDIIIKAIQKINPNAEVSVSGGDINSIVWENGTTPIPKTDIEAKINEIGTESNYVQQRRNAYPEIGDQLDMLWHSINQDPQLKSKYFDFYEAIKAVKVKYPKDG